MAAVTVRSGQLDNEGSDVAVFGQKYLILAVRKLWGVVIHIDHVDDQLRGGQKGVSSSVVCSNHKMIL